MPSTAAAELQVEIQTEGYQGLPADHPGYGMNLGGLIDLAADLREARRVIAEEDKRLGKLFEQLDMDIQHQLRTNGMDMARGTKASASLASKLVPAVEDWEALYAYIKENDALHLLERRVASNAFRELHNAGIALPGVVPFAKASLNLRSI